MASVPVQPGKGAAKPVEHPDDEDVTGAELLQCFGKNRPFSFAAADNFGMDLIHPGFFQCVNLQAEVLVFCADPCVTDFHGQPSRKSSPNSSHIQ
jgi:hypothetical protein